MTDYYTSLGHSYSFSGWNPGESPTECWDKNEWIKCLHGCMLGLNLVRDAGEILRATDDDGLLHELIHLAVGLSICTHHTMGVLRSQIESLEAQVAVVLEKPSLERPDNGFWPIDAKASRKSLFTQIGQMNYRLTALRRENKGLQKRVTGQAAELRRRQGNPGQTTSTAPRPNIGHGHVFPRADGVKARCGGAGICSECSKDAASKAATQANKEEI